MSSVDCLRWAIIRRIHRYSEHISLIIFLLFFIFNNKKNLICLQVMAKLYKEEEAVLCWNGYGTKGAESIVKYILELPPCDHELRTMDVHRLPEVAAPNQIAYMISTSGSVRYKNRDKVK